MADHSIYPTLLRAADEKSLNNQFRQTAAMPTRQPSTCVYRHVYGSTLLRTGRMASCVKSILWMVRPGKMKFTREIMRNAEIYRSLFERFTMRAPGYFFPILGTAASGSKRLVLALLFGQLPAPSR
jgi:hypothetical protein